MYPGTIANIALCVFLVAVHGFGFWFTEILPNMDFDSASSDSKNSVK
jgi:hypothetical protein